VISLAGTRPELSPRFKRLRAEHERALRLRVAGKERLASTDFDTKDAELWGEFKSACLPDAPSAKRWAKCVYCEAKILRANLHVDHQRPKAGVEEWSLDEMRRANIEDTTDTRPNRPWAEHPGYWWLAFEWENYALACYECNSHWKKNLFPVTGARAMVGEDAATIEARLLLDPYSEFESDDHFTWDDKGIVRSETPSGRATILVCGLNRYSLVRERSNRYAEAAPTLTRLVAAYRAKNRVEFDAHARHLCDHYGHDDAVFAGMIRWFVWDLLGRKPGRHWRQLKAFARAT
jgi:hypothetical protein